MMMMIISQPIRIIVTDILISALLFCSSVSAQDSSSSFLSGDNICTAIVSYTKVQKVPITGIQTKIARYVTKCGLGLMKCSRYRMMYVPAYRELASTMYRTGQVCCKGYDLIDNQCIQSVSTGPGTFTTTQSPREETLWADGASVNVSTSNDAHMVPKGTGTQDERIRNVPPIPPLVGNANFPKSTGEGKGYFDGKGNVYTINERNYDVSPDVHKNSHGPSIITVAVGVGVVMSLTGVLVGMIIMKIRFRKKSTLDAIPLTRNKSSRKATRSKSRPLSGRAKGAQDERIASYVSVKDIRENVMNSMRQSPITKSIPQCSLPRIPETSVELLGRSLQDEGESLSAEIDSAPYAVIDKVKASAKNSCCCQTAEVVSESRGSKLDSVCMSCSNSVYAKVDITRDKENSVKVNNVDEIRKRDEIPLSSLYAKVNKNKNSNNEDKRRFSVAILKTTCDDFVYGRLDRPSSLYSSLKSKDNSIKYDHLKRSPRPPGNSRKTNGTSQLYEAL